MKIYNSPEPHLPGALAAKSRWVRSETLKIHKIAPGIRIASALSCVEILVALHYGGIMKFNPQAPYD